jgi:predicted dehydrogenase
MKVAILGSGFGLYGYLQAVVRFPDTIAILPERYRARLRERTDVAGLAPKVFWQPNEATMLDVADAVIVAQRPQDQLDRVSECLERPNILRLLLEKPLAPTPKEAMHLLDRVSITGRLLRIGCTFRYTTWGRSLLAPAREERLGPMNIEWNFRAHHYAHDLQTWKRNVSTGGGALRFYGIHLIALLAELGYAEVRCSEILSNRPGEAEAWRAQFSGLGLGSCSVSVNSNADLDFFTVESENFSVRLHDPFEAPAVDQTYDRRVDVLVDLCREFLYDERRSCEWHYPWLRLWNASEAGVTAGSPAPRAL